MAEIKTKSSVKKTATSGEVVKKTTTKTRAKKTVGAVNNQERYEMIQRTAYFIAEHNGFVGDPHAFWSEAEAQVNKIKS